MIKVLIVELGADVNQTLLWKSQDSSKSEDTKEFTPLLWAIFQNQANVVKLLLEKGADETRWGCCLAKNRQWLCGTALGLALQMNCDQKMIEILQSRVEKKISNSKNTTVIEIGSKTDWKGLIDQSRDRNETDSNPTVASLIQMERNISNLISNPDYLTPSQIEKEKLEIARRAKDLETKIKISAEIEQRINQLKLESEAEQQVNELILQAESDNAKQRRASTMSTSSDTPSMTWL